MTFNFRFWIAEFSIGEKGMNKKRTWIRWLDFVSDNRIENLKWLGLSVIVFVLVMGGAAAKAQQPKKLPGIGFLSAPSPSAVSARTAAFRQGLRALGYVEGKNIVIEQRYAEGKLDRLPVLAAELVRLKVDVIVTGTSAGTRSAKEATATIPIVMAQDGDPVGNGFVASLARPGGNITGLSSLAPEISGKRLELLKEIVPKFSRVAVFGNSASPGNAQSLKEIELAAGALGLQLQYLDIRGPKEIETAFQATSKGRANAVLVLANPVLNFQRKQVVDLAVKTQLPAIYYAPEWVQDGGLMSYGASITDLDRRAATYVDKILKGAKPADLPIEQPKKLS
jgi:putative ABC transport system substrate-binding protein